MSVAAVFPQLFDDVVDPRDDRSVAEDNRGAIMVIGVFMAMLVTGFLYYIIGIGNTLVYRERLNDAADAIAFSGAVVHARGMNLIALINMVLLVLMTVHMALWLVSKAVYAAVIICGLFLCPLLPALEAADRILDTMLRTYDRGILMPALQLGHLAQEAIKTTFPGIAQGRVLASTLSGTYSPPASGGFLLPLVPYRQLPVTPVRLNEQPRRPYPESPGGICRRAARNIADAIAIPFGILGSSIRGAVSSALGGLLSAASDLACPDDRPSLRNYDLDIGSGNCTDGMPGQDCEYAQLRGVAVAASTPFARNVQGVNIATLGRTAGGGVLSSFESFAQVGVAQAEYYYDGSEDRDQWMWHMYWRARFRRVRMGGAVSVIPGIGVATDVIDRIVVH